MTVNLRGAIVGGCSPASYVTDLYSSIAKGACSFTVALISFHSL